MAKEKIVSGVPRKINLTFGTNVTNVVNDQCYKCGKVVSISLELTIKATTEHIINLFTVPSDCRPAGTIFYTGIDNTNDQVMNCNLTNTGESGGYRASTASTTSVRVGFTYIAA